MNLGITGTSAEIVNILPIISPLSLTKLPVACYSLRKIYDSAKAIISTRDSNMLVWDMDFENLLRARNMTVSSWLDQSPNGMHLHTTKRPDLQEKQWFTQYHDFTPAISLYETKFLKTEKSVITLGVGPELEIFVVASGALRIKIGSLEKDISQAAKVSHYSFREELLGIDKEIPNQQIEILGDGQIFELLVYVQELSKEERDSILHWQQAYWGKYYAAT